MNLTASKCGIKPHLHLWDISTMVLPWVDDNILLMVGFIIGPSKSIGANVY